MKISESNNKHLITKISEPDGVTTRPWESFKCDGFQFKSYVIHHPLPTWGEVSLTIAYEGGSRVNGALFVSRSRKSELFINNKQPQATIHSRQLARVRGGEGTTGHPHSIRSADILVLRNNELCIDHRNKIKVPDPVVKDLISKK